MEKQARKVALVTGGASNIGRAIVLTFAGEGANVVIADLDEKQAQKTAADANTLGGQAMFIKTDVTDKDSVEAMIKQSLEKFGQVDILVNKVGWSVPDVLLIDKPDDQIDKEIKVNYWGVIFGSRAVAPHMIGRKYGKIINIASDAGRMGVKGHVVFSGAKGAVILIFQGSGARTGFLQYQR